LISCNLVPENIIEPNISDNYQKRVNSKVRFENGRLVFENSEVFKNLLNYLTKNPQSIDSFENAFPNYVSWRRFNRQILNDSSASPLILCDSCLELPNFFQVILNSKAEFQVGNIIVFVSEGKSYEIPYSQENSLKVNGVFDKRLLIEIPSYNFENILVENRENGRNYADAKYQYEYHFGGHTYKQVFEIAATKFKLPGTSSSGSFLYMRMKLEYLKRRTFGSPIWTPAGENRTTLVNNFNGSSSYNNQSYTSRNHYINEPYTTSNQNKEFYLNEVYGSSHLIDPSKWTYSFNSYLMHLYVSSHGQGPSLIYTGGRGLYVPGANWLKTY
jgi:hypothetical protein